MKNQVLLLFVFSFLTLNLFAIRPITDSSKSITANHGEESFWSQLSQEELMTLSPKEIKEKTGQKLNFKERLALKVGRKIYKKSKKRAYRTGLPMDKTSLASFIFSMMGVLSLVIPFLFGLFAIVGFVLGIIALTRKDNYDTKRGKGFAIAGTVIGGLYVLILFAAIVSVFSI